jgi:AcrR family transcriptional regulator
MPRAGLTTSGVVAAGAELADEVGIESVSLAILAARLGVKPPALYKHIESLGDLQHRIATLAMNGLTDALRDTLQGKSGADAIAALFRALQTYIAEHPGQYSATTNAKLQGDDDPLLAATTRFIQSVRAVLFGYGVQPDQVDHAIRMLRCMIHGYALLQAANAFHWSNDPDESMAWMIQFVDAGLTAVGAA